MDDIRSELTWYALHCHPHKEGFLFSQLTARSVEAFYPCLRVKPVNPRSRKIRPYFPGYLFVRLDMTSAAKLDIRWMPHVYGLVTFGDIPAPVPDLLVNRIRQQLEAVQAENQTVTFHQGEPVALRDDLFRGYEAVFDTAIAGTERVRVLLLLMNKHVPLVVERGRVEPLRKASG